MNRIDYLLAASNLAQDLPPDLAAPLFEQALTETVESVTFEAEQLEADARHPFSQFRLNIGDGDSRPAAVLLCARLANGEEERQQARIAALRLIGADGDADLHVTRALQVLQNDLGRDAYLLSKQGWALRCLAAIVWVRTPDLAAALGEALAVDPAARVRRTLAQELAQTSSDTRTEATRQQLLIDVRHSVRVHLQLPGQDDHQVVHEEA